MGRRLLLRRTDPTTLRVEKAATTTTNQEEPLEHDDDLGDEIAVVAPPWGTRLLVGGVHQGPTRSRSTTSGGWTAAALPDASLHRPPHDAVVIGSPIIMTMMGPRLLQHLPRGAPHFCCSVSGDGCWRYVVGCGGAAAGSARRRSALTQYSVAPSDAARCDKSSRRHFHSDTLRCRSACAHRGCVGTKPCSEPHCCGAAARRRRKTTNAAATPRQSVAS